MADTESGGQIRYRPRGFWQTYRVKPGRAVPHHEAHAQIEAADLMVRKGCALFDSGEPCGAEANMAKYLAAEASWAGAQACFDTFGGLPSHDYDIVRKWRRLFKTHPFPPTWCLTSLRNTFSGCPVRTRRRAGCSVQTQQPVL